MQTQVATPYFLYESCTAHLLHFPRQQGGSTFPPREAQHLGSSLFHREKEGGNLGYANGTKEKIRIKLQAAKENGNHSLILSAFGCGAFKNDPAQIIITTTAKIKKLYNDCRS